MESVRHIFIRVGCYKSYLCTDGVGNIKDNELSAAEHKKDLFKTSNGKYMNLKKKTSTLKIR